MILNFPLKRNYILAKSEATGPKVAQFCVFGHSGKQHWNDSR